MLEPSTARREGWLICGKRRPPALTAGCSGILYWRNNARVAAIERLSGGRVSPVVSSF